MKYVLTSILALLVTVSFSYAQTDDTSIEIKKPAAKQSPKGRQSRKYSRILSNLINKADRLEIDEKRKAELVKIRDEYVFAIIKQENELMNARATYMKSLSNADFDASKVKEEVKASQTIEEQIMYKLIGGMEALRKTVGSENYNSLFAGRKKQRREMRRMQQGKEQTQEKSPESK
jgi:hypothetical protein